MTAILLKNCSILDEPFLDLLPNRHILIEDNQIKKIQDTPITSHENTHVIDLSGYVVMPGLIDAHVHVSSPPTNLLTDAYSETYIGIYAKVELEKKLQRGFTSIRDAGG